jgi:hypothetical protein
MDKENDRGGAEGDGSEHPRTERIVQSDPGNAVRVVKSVVLPDSLLVREIVWNLSDSPSPV